MVVARFKNAGVCMVLECNIEKKMNFLTEILTAFPEISWKLSKNINVHSLYKAERFANEGFIVMIWSEAQVWIRNCLDMSKWWSKRDGASRTGMVHGSSGKQKEKDRAVEQC